MSDEPKKGFFPHAASMKDLHEGDRVTFDPFFGVDEVLEVTRHETGMGELPGFLYAQTLIIVKVQRRPPIGEPYEATVLRNGSEPVTLWRLEEKLPDDIRDRLTSLRDELNSLGAEREPSAA